MSFNWMFEKQKVVYGAGCVNELATMELPGKKALVVTTNGKSVKRLGYLDKVVSLMAKQGVDSVVYDQVGQNPTLDAVMDAAKVGKENGVDFVVALGGGSAIDASKMIGIMCKNPGSLWDYMAGGTAKGLPVPNGMLPVVAITTTAGTGSEIDPWAVITNEATNEKVGWGTDFTFATIAVVDPEMMTSVPPKYKAYQGLDTFFHLSECYISKGANPMSDMYALKGIELVAKYLPTAVANGDIDSVSQVALANSLGGYTQYISGCVSQHPMEHALSGYHPNVIHGAGLIAMSEAYFRFYMDKPGYADRYVDMARAMGVDVDSLPENERAEAFVKAMVKLEDACGVGNLKMSEWGVKADECMALAEKAHAIGAGVFAGADRYTTSVEETAEIFKAAYK